MRGHPLWQTILVVLAFLVVAWPVRQLTRPSVATPQLTTQATHPDAPMALTITAAFAPPPESFTVTAAGQSVLSGKGPQTEFIVTWNAVVPKDGVDLSVQAAWPAEAPPGPRAARFVIRYPNGHQTEKTLWTPAGEPLGDLLTVTPN